MDRDRFGGIERPGGTVTLRRVKNLEEQHLRDTIVSFARLSVGMIGLVAKHAPTAREEATRLLLDLRREILDVGLQSAIDREISVLTKSAARPAPETPDEAVRHQATR